MNNIIKWGHFSDLHFQYNEKFVTNTLREKLLKSLDDDKIKLDFIVITGDISNRGAFSDNTLEFIEEILEKTGCTKENLFICCGNHDIERNNIRCKIISDSNDKKEQDKDYNIDDSELKYLFKTGHEKFIATYKKITDKDYGERAHFVEEREHYNIYTVNTCILSGQDGEEGKLLVCDDHLSLLSKSKSSNKDKLNIAIGHHGIDCIHKAERNQLTSFFDSINIDLYMCGHNHEIGFKEWEGSENRISQFMCGGVFKDSYNAPSFIITEYNVGTHACISKIYSYSTNNLNWNPMSDARPPFKKGIHSFTPKRLASQAVQEVKALPLSGTNLQPPKIYDYANSLSMDISAMSPDFLINHFLKTSASVSKIVNRNNIFQSSSAYISSVVEGLEEKHLILCDRIYNKFYENSRYSSLRDLKLCLAANNQHSTGCDNAIHGWIKLVEELMDGDFPQVVDVVKHDLEKYASAIIEPVIKNYGRLFGIASNFIIGDGIDDEDMLKLLNITKITIENENNDFFGFTDQLEHLKSIVSRKEPGYFCIAADEGYGKTSLMSKLIGCMMDSKTSSNSGKIASLLPWLPHAIVVFGKQVVGASVNNAVQMIVEQANLLLVNPVSYDSNTSQNIGSILYTTFDALVKELGGIVIILDAVDEFKASDLSFLPESLPDGITVLISARRFAQDYKNGKKNITGIKHSGFSSKDEKAIMKYYDLSSEDKGASQFVKDVLKKTNGWPMIVCDIKKQLKEFNNDFAKVRIESSLNPVFYRKKGMWKENGSTDCCRWKLLELFAVVASASYLSMDNIQSYLMTDARYSSTHSEDIAGILDCVSDQLVANDGGLNKLKYASFAEYITDKKTGFTTYELRKIIKDIVYWLGKYADDNIELLAPFYLAWRERADENIKDNVEKIIEALIDKNRCDMLTSIAVSLMTKGKPDDTVERCLEYASKQSENAKLLYAIYLHSIIKTDDSRKKAVGFYRELAEKENEQAVCVYADMLRIGTEYVEKDEEKALELLGRVEHNGSNAVISRIYNIISKGSSRYYDNDRAIMLLYKGVDKNYPQAMKVLGMRLLDGDGVKPNRAEGEKWLRKATDAGEPEAMRVLGLRLVEGNGIKQNSAEGEKWLKMAADSGEPQAMRVLGMRLIDGDGIKQNKVEGEKWLRKTADAGDSLAMGVLGSQLLDGNGIKQNKVEGEKWLRRSADAGNSQAMGQLGLRQLEGDGIKQNKVEGEKWLRKAADEEEPQAMGILGIRLIDGIGIKQNIVEGIELCKNAIDKGYGEAANSLGIYFYEKGDYRQSVDYFEKGISLSRQSAKISLSYVIRKGKYSDYSGVPTIEELLSDSVNKNKHPLALINYALYLVSSLCPVADWTKADDYITLINCNDVNDITSAINWWQGVSDEGDLEGDLVLGWLCIKGKAKDPKGMTVKERFAKAKEVYAIPDWLMEQGKVL